MSMGVVGPISWVTVKEAAGLVEVDPSRIRHLLLADQRRVEERRAFPSARKAEPEEEKELLASGRVDRVLADGVWLLRAEEVRARAERDLPLGRPHQWNDYYAECPWFSGTASPAGEALLWACGDETCRDALLSDRLKRYYERCVPAEICVDTKIWQEMEPVAYTELLREAYLQQSCGQLASLLAVFHDVFGIARVMTQAERLFAGQQQELSHEAKTVQEGVQEQDALRDRQPAGASEEAGDAKSKEAEAIALSVEASHVLSGRLEPDEEIGEGTGNNEGEGQEKKGLRRYYSNYKERATAYYDPLSGQLYSEKSRVHAVGRAAGLEAVLEACDCPVLYLLPDATGGYPTASDYYQIAGIEVKKYLEKRQAATVWYQGKRINVYPIATWCEVAPGVSLKGVIQGMRTLQQELEKSFQPQKVTTGRTETFAIPLLATPSQMGADLLKRSLPYEQVYEPLPEQTALTILQELGQGRIETFYHERDEVERVYAYDGRWMYASCLRHVPVGPVIHDELAEILPYVPGFYRVEVHIPREWRHIGLLPMRNPGGSSQKFSYPRMGGQSFESWCTSSELSLALKEGWQVQVRERILWPQTHVLPEPLKLWGERLIALRMEKAPTYVEPIRSMLQAAVRNILLHTAGGFHRVTREFDGYTSDITAIPTTATSFELLPDGEIWRYTQADRLSPLQQMLSQPHWAATIWGAARKKLAAQALQVPFEDLMAVRVDAVWTVREMLWKDTGKVGVFRREQLLHDRNLLWPKDTGEMVQLVQRTKGREEL